MWRANSARAANFRYCCSKVCNVLRRNDIVTYRAEGYSNGETVGSVDGYTVFVPRLIAGEVARVKVNFVKKTVAYGTVEQVLQPSPHRISPPCAHFGVCGGCALAHMSYREQLRFKQNKVTNNFAKIAKLSVEALPCVPSPLAMGYRNKISLPVRGVKGNVVIGMFERNSHNVVQTRGCALAGGWSDKLIAIFAEYCNKTGVQPYNEQDFSGDVRHLAARYIDGQLLVTVVSNGLFRHDLQPFADALSEHFDKYGLFVNVNTARNNVILGKTTVHVYGIDKIEGEHLGVKFRLSPDSFFQVNDGVKELIYAKTRELLDVSQTQVLVDCFSGVGVLTDVLASERYDTYAIEIDPCAERDADEMAKLNNVPRVTNICGDVTVELPKIVAANQGKRFAVVVDPPRKGLNETICKTLIQAAPQNIVYISCDSATLARDVATLAAAYDVTYLEPYDMFPQTDQVESVARLTRRQLN